MTAYWRCRMALVRRSRAWHPRRRSGTQHPALRRQTPRRLASCRKARSAAAPLWTGAARTQAVPGATCQRNVIRYHCPCPVRGPSQCSAAQACRRQSLGALPVFTSLSHLHLTTVHLQNKLWPCQLSEECSHRLRYGSTGPAQCHGPVCWLKYDSSCQPMRLALAGCVALVQAG